MRGARRTTQPRTTADASNSGHGSGSLMDAFVAEEESCPSAGADWQVMAPQAIE